MGERKRRGLGVQYGYADPLGIGSFAREDPRGGLVADPFYQQRSEDREVEQLELLRRLADRRDEPPPTSPIESSKPDRRAGGAPSKAVMPRVDAERLETVLDLHRGNGHDPNITELAGYFGVDRGRIRQAIEMRAQGVSLHDPAGGSAQFRTVVDGDGNVHWPSRKKLRKS